MIFNTIVTNITQNFDLLKKRYLEAPTRKYSCLL